MIMNFCSVFRENSKRTRIQFFRNELIQLMWTRFIDIERDFLAQYLGELSKDEGSQSKSWVLLKDI